LANRLVAGFIRFLKSISGVASFVAGIFTDSYDLFLAKSAVQRSLFGRQDATLRELFGMDTVFLTQNERICAFLECCLRHEVVDDIEPWTAHKISPKTFIVSYRIRYVDGRYQSWYWVVNLRRKTVREITENPEELKKYHIRPNEDTHILIPQYSS